VYQAGPACISSGVQGDIHTDHDPGGRGVRAIEAAMVGGLALVDVMLACTAATILVAAWMVLAAGTGRAADDAA